MKYLFICYLLLGMISFTSKAQTINPDISARVDTSKVAVKAVYQLYKNYLNSRPDSIYKNPNWKEEETEYYLKSKILRVDRAANLMFNYYKSNQYLGYYIPKILQIDSIAVNRYQIKTIFAVANPDQEYKKFTPNCITKLYAVRNSQGEFKLENVISYDTRNWKKYRHKFINYIVHPDCNFNKKEAEKAIAFCEKIAKQFKIKIQPFTYYLVPNSDEMGRLYNFEYWMSYMGGQTMTPLNEIFTSYGSENYPHEFVHMLFPYQKDPRLHCPMIINEGLATWLAGPSANETFEEALQSVSKSFQKKERITFEDIMTFQFKNEFDNSILYVTGGVICKFVFEKHGQKGIWELYNCNKDNFQSVLEGVFGMSYNEVERLIIAYIKNYSRV
jgi:hypothetical protein